MSGNVRPATIADCTAIQQIYAHHVLTGTASFEIEPPSVYEIQQRLEGIIGGGYPYGVYVEDGTILGYCYVAAYRTRPAYRYTVENSVYVQHDALGFGIGTLLLTWLIIECQQREYREIVAVIGDSNNSASIALHKKCGFQHIGTLSNVGYKFDRWLDSVLMQYHID